MFNGKKTVECEMGTAGKFFKQWRRKMPNARNNSGCGRRAPAA
jgi:hypothetical protein